MFLYPFSNHVPFLILIGLVTASYQDDPIKCTGWSQCGPTFNARPCASWLMAPLAVERPTPWRIWRIGQPLNWSVRSGVSIQGSEDHQNPQVFSGTTGIRVCHNSRIQFYHILSKFQVYHYLQDISVDLLRGDRSHQVLCPLVFQAWHPARQPRWPPVGWNWKSRPLALGKSCRKETAPEGRTYFWQANQVEHECVSRVSFHCLPIHVAWNNLLHVWTLFHTHTQHIQPQFQELRKKWNRTVSERRFLKEACGLSDHR